MNKTEFNGYVYDFSVDYDATDIHDILDIHKYLIEKNNIVYMKIFLFVKKVFLIGLTISLGFASLDSLSCLSMNNQECKTRTQVVNVNEDEMSKSNETRHKEWHKTCKSECKFGDNGCNTKQRWNKDKCRCECKELIDKGMCDKRFIWNPSNWECK